eukprot:sb/3466580/
MPLADRATTRRKIGLITLIAVLLVLCTVTVFIYLRVLRSSNPPTGSIISSDNDNRAYTRQWEVLLSEAHCDQVLTMATQQAVAVNVGVGHLGDRAGGFPAGTAHFLEHLLFMGTEKFPAMNHADEVVNKAGGGISAYTDYEVTNYYAYVNNNLKGTMDVLAQFFVAPLMTSDAIKREMGAVESEYNKGKPTDIWSFHQLTRQLSNPDAVYYGYICYVGRIPARSILIIQDRNNPCVLLTHSLNCQYVGLHCPASVHGHVNLTPYIQNVLVKHHDRFYSVLYILIKQEFSQHNKNISVMGVSILSGKNAKCSESQSLLPTTNLSYSDPVHSHFK